MVQLQYVNLSEIGFMSNAKARIENDVHTEEMTLSEALTRWMEITRVDPGQQSFRFGDMQVMDLHKALREALELDPSELTGMMMFDVVVERYFSDRAFGIKELLDEPEKVGTYLKQCNSLRTFLQQDHIKDEADDFRQKVRSAVDSYGALREDVSNMISDSMSLTLLRRDALRTLKHLSVHQFMQGQPEGDGVKPMYGKSVYQWNNINSLLAAMPAMPSGVTVNLIRHPVDAYRSYFVFAIRNGSNLFLFTDKEAKPHPLADDFTRRPERVLAARMERNWFPYQLLGAELNDNGDLYFPMSQTKTLVPYQKNVQAVIKIDALEPTQIIWLSMMLDLIMEKFWNQKYQAPAISYTAEMLQVENPLLLAAEKANLPVPNYPQLVLPKLTLGDLHSSKATEEQGGWAFGEGRNRWLEDRYCHLVDDSALNLIASDTEAFVRGKMENEALGEVKLVARGEIERLRYSESMKLKTLEASAFGDAKSLAADRLFMARVNYTSHINLLAQAEYQRRHKEVVKWVKDRMSSNMSNLQPLFANKEVWHDLGSPFGVTSGVFNTKTHQYRFMKRVELERRKGGGYEGDPTQNFFNHGNIWFHGGFKGSRYLCYETGAEARHLVRFSPKTIQDLAFMCGCEISDLPDVLQHWDCRAEDPSKHHNHLLNRVDPLEWNIHDPWADLSIEVFVLLSRSGMSTALSQSNSKLVG